MSRDLVIIESSGKLRTLRRVFEVIGFHADICATIGHFLENPPSLSDLGIEWDGAFVEPRRGPYRPESYEYLCTQLRACAGRILVATDNDQEGHVIAQDVAYLAAKLAPARPVMRMLMGGLDRASISQALGCLRPIDPRKAIPGTARRIADRIIGGCMSDFERNRPVGRVQSALLGLCATGLPHSHVSVQMPCTDGGKVFRGAIPVFGATTPAELIAALGTLDLPPAPVGRSEQRLMQPPLIYGDALLGLHSALSLTLGEAASLLQRMYEAGEISYPRTHAAGFSETGKDAAARLARARGVLVFKKEALPSMDAAPHEAIRVLDESRIATIDLGVPLKLHDSDQSAALTFVARRMLEAGIAVRRDYPDLSGAAPWTRQIEWVCDTRRVLPWRYPDPPPVVRHEPQAALLTAMMASGIGRPSTYAQHATRFTDRELLDYKLALTPKGRDWLSFAPPALIRPETSSRIEALLDTETLPGADAEETIGTLVARALELATNGDSTTLEAIYEQMDVSAADKSEDQHRYRPRL